MSKRHVSGYGTGRARSNFAAKSARDDSNLLLEQPDAGDIPSDSQHGASERADPSGSGARSSGVDMAAAASSSSSTACRSTKSNPWKMSSHGPAESTPLLPKPGLAAHALKQQQPSADSPPQKLGTFAGVFVPTTLNVLSILMFLRFGFILGQSGFVGMTVMLVLCYVVNLLTTMSLSAIATNGTVKGGGAYYLISRSLGQEFGGSIGIIFYLGSVFNTGMNAVGMIDCLVAHYGTTYGGSGNWMPDGFWWQYLWGSIVLLFCTLICLAGSGIFARASNGLLVILLLATFSIPISALFVRPFSKP